MNNETQHATEIINNTSDTQMGGTGIGQSSPTIDLNANKNTYTPPKPEPKKEYTQGQHSQNIENWQKEIDWLNEILDKGTRYDYGSWIVDTAGKGSNLGKSSQEAFYNYLYNKYKDKPEEFKDTDFVADWRNAMNDYIATLKDQIYDTKNKSNYDNRTDEQIREDKSVERAVEDARRAGINPAALNFGTTAGGGGGGGSASKDEEEERKRKKRAKEEAERRRKELLMQNVMRTLQMIGYTTGRIGGYATLGHVRNVGNMKLHEAKQAAMQPKINSTKAAPINNNDSPTDRMKKNLTKENKWLEEYLDELKNL